MSQLETDYPGVVFVYMTGHVDHWDDANNKAANQMIRNYCRDNNKILYDFADIDSHDPDGTFYEFPSDNCDYYASVDGTLLGNWALAWQDSHIEDTDWYSCASAHSQPLNANQKAYAAWWLWARLGGWAGPLDSDRDDDIDGIDLSAYISNNHFTELSDLAAAFGTVESPSSSQAARVRIHFTSQATFKTSESMVLLTIPLEFRKTITTAKRESYQFSRNPRLRI